MNIGEKIRHRRIELNMTQRQVANLAGISVSFLSDIERGRSNPSLENTLKLGKALNLPIGEVMDPNDADKVLEKKSSYEILDPYLTDFNLWPDEDKQDVIKFLEYKRSSLNKSKNKP